jgi:GGDEF domain-containing protein
MIIRLRYPAEMRKVLKAAQYEKVIKQLSILLVDTVRLEDRVYSIDENGGFAVILTCDKEGTKIVENRLRNKMDDPKWFEGIAEKQQIRTEVKIGYLQYDKSKYNRNANMFKDDVEEEVNYDM